MAGASPSEAKWGVFGIVRTLLVLVLVLVFVLVLVLVFVGTACAGSLLVLENSGRLFVPAELAPERLPCYNVSGGCAGISPAYAVMHREEGNRFDIRNRS